MMTDAILTDVHPSRLQQLTWVKLADLLIAQRWLHRSSTDASAAPAEEPSRLWHPSPTDASANAGSIGHRGAAKRLN
jgi:hypothetical protein